MSNLDLIYIEKFLKKCDLSKVPNEDTLKEHLEKCKNDILQTKIEPYIKDNFLAHWTLAIKNYISEVKKDQVKKVLQPLLTSGKENSDDTIQDCSFDITIQRDLKKRKGSDKLPAYVQYHNTGAVIFYNIDAKPEEIRFYIAHELGHIITKYIYNHQFSEHVELKEIVADFWACIIINDKSEFYKKINSFSSKSDPNQSFQYSSFEAIANEYFDFKKDVFN